MTALKKNTFFISLMFLLLCHPADGNTQQTRTEGYPGPETGWSFPLTGGFVHQFDTDLDDGGSFNATRLYFQGGPTFSLAPRRSISFALGYGYDGYDFSGDTSLGSLTPWEDIHSLRFSVPVRWGFNEKWSLLAVPTLRFTAEDGADWNEAATGGGFAGFSYRFGERLSIGPGIGILSQLEDNASFFPILIVRWKITEQLSLRTGSGLGATLGPGLSLFWQPSSHWDILLGGRYEKLRFRLDSDGTSPAGIGEDSSFPLVVGATYKFDRQTRVSVIGGLELGGELRLEDKAGRLQVKDHYDPGIFLGVTFTVQL